MSEEQLLAELALLYNHRDTDEPQFTRWQMVTAIYHGMKIGSRNLSDNERPALDAGHA